MSAEEESKKQKGRKKPQQAKVSSRPIDLHDNDPVRIPLPPTDDRRNVLITSALPYVNNEPHLGNIIGCVLSADVFARYCRLRGYNTVYVCGTDEYGTATETKALEEKLTPREICDKYHAIHRDIYQWFNISFDEFGRTSTPTQTRICQDIFKKIEENQLLQEQELEQLYCEKYNTFLADRFVEGTCPKCNYNDARGDQCDRCQSLLTPTELINPRYKVDPTAPLGLRPTKHLFLDLPVLSSELEAWVKVSSEQGKWSENSVNVTAAWIRDGLKPRCITRDLKWGTPVPKEGYENKVFYVWFDAPIGYISIHAHKFQDWELWWKNPNQVKLFQFMGKDNIPFHTVIFPSTLIATRQKWTMLHHISTTEYLNYEDGKFSKSRGVGVFGTGAKDTNIPPDVWRYYLLSNRPETGDSVFSWPEFQARNNSELLGNIGNFVNRTLTFIYSTFQGVIPAIGELDATDQAFVQEIDRKVREYVNLLESVRLRDGLFLVMAIGQDSNKYYQTCEPWKKDLPAGRSGTVLSICAHVVELLSVLLYPYMPAISKEIRTQLRLPPLIPKESEVPLFEGVAAFKDGGHFQLKTIPEGHLIDEPQVLFAPLGDEHIAQLRAKFSPLRASVEFPALIRVGKVVDVGPHPTAPEQSYVLKIDFGSASAPIQVVAGLKVHYAADILLGKSVVCVCNLKHTEIKGVVSQGMVLCADKRGVLGLLTVKDDSLVGVQVVPKGAAYKPTEDLDIKDFKKLPLKTNKGVANFMELPLQADGHDIIAEKVENTVATIK